MISTCTPQRALIDKMLVMLRGTAPTLATLCMQYTWLLFFLWIVTVSTGYHNKYQIENSPPHPTIVKRGTTSRLSSIIDSSLDTFIIVYNEVQYYTDHSRRASSYELCRRKYAKNVGNSISNPGRSITPAKTATHMSTQIGHSSSRVGSHY